MPQLPFYVSSFADKGKGGIYRCLLDGDTGSIRITGANHDLDRVLFLKYVPPQRGRAALLYATTDRGKDASTVAVFSVDETTEELTLINEQPAYGGSPCYVDLADNLLLIANYSGGHVSVMPIRAGGGLDPMACRIDHKPSERSPKGAASTDPSHPHSIVVDPSGQYALAGDLGINEVLVYQIDRAGKRLTPHQPASVGVHPGAGPRHLRFSADGRHVYLINEHDATLIVFKWNPAAATLEAIQELSTLPPGTTVKNHAAEILIHPNGRFLYVSNRGHDSIAVLTIDHATGKVELIQNESTQGSFPRGFTLDAAGRWLVVGNERSDSVLSLKIDPDTGLITPTQFTVTIPTPVHFAFANR